jgi:hypothetical protein
MIPGSNDLARHLIEHGSTPEDLGPRLADGPEEADEDLLTVHEHWPDGLGPVPAPLPEEPSLYDPLPQADYLVITWTVAEQNALAAVLTPGFERRAWYRYARGFEKRYLPFIRKGAPARKAMRLGSWFPTRIGGATVMCFKSELHLNQDGIMQPEGYATLPVKDLFQQLIDEVKPKLIITVGTAGATYPDHDLGDVMVTRAARFRCHREFEKAPFNHTTYTSDFEVDLRALPTAQGLIDMVAGNLVEPDFAPPTAHYPGWDQPLPGYQNKPRIRLDGGDGPGDLPAFQPILSTDFFEFGTTGNKLEEIGCGVEMGDAALGLAVQELGTDQRWLVIRNASDPAINHHLPRGRRPLDMQGHWAVWYYEAFGFWTSVNSALATWAVIVGDNGESMP